MNRATITVLGTIPLLWLAACSKGPAQASITGAASSASSTVAQAASAPAVQTAAVPNLERFNGKPPGDLLNDELIGKVIRAVVPQSQFKCMDDIFNYMHDLEIDSSGTVTANMGGSHADQFMEAFISVAPGGVVNVVLQCDPQRDPKGKYQFFTNEGIRAATPKAILDWMYVVGRDGDTVTKSDGKEQIDISYAKFLEGLLAGAAKNSTASATAPPIAVTAAATNGVASQTAPVVTTGSPLIGDWTCQSRKTNGASFSSAFRFTSDGGFAYADPQARMIGTYQPNGPNAKVAIDQVTNGGRVSASRMQVDIAFISATPGQVKFDMTLVKIGAATSNNCVSEAVAAATPAPKVNVCDINPAACAAVQRNHDIRTQVQDQRCEILRSQLGGTMGGDYQLAKAGCQ
jgi:hypothetical protein